MDNAKLSQARANFLQSIANELLVIDENGIASNADKSSAPSKKIALQIARRIGAKEGTKLKGQTAGNLFEKLCSDFIGESFAYFSLLRPGQWTVEQLHTRAGLAVAQFEQYEHLHALQELAKLQPSLAATLGNDYSIAPDIIVYRTPETDNVINSQEHLVDISSAKASALRQSNNKKPILHASISCKWTMRSDRAQNARSEALNLVRNRKGRLPHVVAVTAEPTPARIASLALGTGDLDCVYHFALYELVAALDELKDESAAEQLAILIDGKRLKDISDLPLDLCV